MMRTKLGWSFSISIARTSTASASMSSFVSFFFKMHFTAYTGVGRAGELRGEQRYTSA